MQVTKNITLDLLETGSPVIIKAKQNDRNTRYIAAHLYVDGLAYPVPSGTEIAFRYKKPDGTAGFYDALPNNSPAITISGNTVTVELVEQVLTVAGCVHCEINMYNAASEKLTTFTFEISVEESVLTDAEIISSDYYNLLTSEIAKALQAVTDATEQAENAAQSAQEAADSAAMSKDWAAGQPVTYNGTPVSIAYAGTNRIASITAYGETPQGGTTEVPVALTGVDSVQVCGNNLFVNKATEGTTNNGVTFTLNSDKSITVNGTNTSSSRSAVYHTSGGIINTDIAPGTYIISGGSAPVVVEVVIYKANGETEYFSSSLSSTVFNIEDGDILKQSYVLVRAGQTADNVKVYPMLNVGSTALPYEPYNGNITQLPIPRELHRIGEAADKCITRVKSVYDKRIVLDGSLDEAFIQTNIIDGWIQIATESDAVIPESTSIVGSIKSSYLKAYAIEEVYSKKHSGISVDSNRRIRLSFKTSEYPDVTSVETARTYLSAHPLTVYYQSTAYDGTNGLPVCLTEYQTGFVELDGTENWSWNTSTAWAYIATFLPNNKTGVAPVCSHYQGTGAVVPAASQVAINELGSLIIKDPSWQSVEDAKAYLAAQKAAGTPVQVAYQLATPEVYATDPVDFDNTAGPLTVMTGGEVEVRMTELVGTRSDVSNNTVAFTETAQDADIASGEKLSVLFGKIKKRFSAMLAAIADRYTKAEAEARFMPNPNLLDNSDFVRRVNQRGVSGTITTAGYFIDRWKLVSGSVTLSADGLQLAAGTVIAQILEYAAGTDVIASLGITSGTASAAYDNATKTYTITATTACTLIWAKLEKGSIATPYVPKGYGAELAECMRYFEIAKMGFTYSQLPSNYLCTTSFKVQKRTIPTVTVVAGSIKNLYESLIDASVTTVSTTRDSIVSVALSQTVLNNQAITLTAVLSADL